jgi:hypothetical protein
MRVAAMAFTGINTAALKFLMRQRSRFYLKGTYAIIFMKMGQFERNKEFIAICNLDMK